jgi:primosomal protein N'
VYLQTAARHLASGRSVLLLTPEIGLIPQLLDRARHRFGPGVLQYHSGMAERDRIACWRTCLAAGQEGQPRLVVGTRSAIFLPLSPLGLIVLDEEHDSSWKQDSPMPCYHARDVARLRCRLEGSQLVLGSATPSLESWLAAQSPGGQTALLRLPDRIGGRPLPAVRVVDMRHELAEGHRRLLSRPLLDRLESLLVASEGTARQLAKEEENRKLANPNQPAPNCQAVTAQLVSQLQALPTAKASKRPATLSLPQPPGPGLLHLRWEAGGVQRERLLSLSAVGLCREGSNA